MPRQRNEILIWALLAVAFAFLRTPTAVASSEKIIYDFCAQTNCSDGANPDAALVRDAAGNLYGTTEFGGTHQKGTIFELAPDNQGNWTETVLYNFCSANNCTDGDDPSTVLTFDNSGNLYGMTAGGGTTSATCRSISSLGCGTVFELTPGANGQWTESVLYSFCSLKNCTDGGGPTSGGLIFDSAGSLYGSVGYGGNVRQCPRQPGCGTVFQLTPGSNGQWTETVLHTFHGRCGDGSAPSGYLAFDLAGRLYGTTRGGGARISGGIIFRLTRGTDGKWTETVLHRFRGGKDGALPIGGVSLDSGGDVYGTTFVGGVSGLGTVFLLNWQGEYTVLHRFRGGKDGVLPFDALSLDAAGNLYGTTSEGGSGSECKSDCGIAFELSQVNGWWREKVLHRFGHRQDGGYPASSLAMDGNGNLYGTTLAGGTNHNQSICGANQGCGTVFEITP